MHTTRTSRLIRNFGGNVKFRPKHFYQPQTTEELLEILNRHAAGQVRVVASLHAWSEAVESDDAMIDLGAFNHVQIEQTAAGVVATVGGGCDLQRLLDIVHAQTDCTLPTHGGIKKQTIAGAISTGTHGSGRPSLSHYMEEITVAAYDGQGRAKLSTFTEGAALQAARCAIGCMGVIVSVKLRCVPKYVVTESSRPFTQVSQALAWAEPDLLEQFILMPFSWKGFFFSRRVGQKAPAGLAAKFQILATRAYGLLIRDLLLHAQIWLLVRGLRAKLIGRPAVNWFYGTLLAGFIREGGATTDTSEHAITLKHDIFRHLETELFIPASCLEQAVALTKAITDLAGGQTTALDPAVAQQLEQAGLRAGVEALQNVYIQHYPIYFRRVLADDTLISMTAQASEPYYSMSLFTYLPPTQRGEYLAYARVVALVLAKLCAARPHWGKYFPLNQNEIAGLYPALPDFRAQCQLVDPNGVFQNHYVQRVLGFGSHS